MFPQPKLDHQAHQAALLLPPQPIITYDKSVQTASIAIGTDEEDLPDNALLTDRRAHESNIGRESEAELRARLLAEFEAEKSRLDAEIAQAEREAEEARRKGPDPEELSSILASTDFASFLEENSKIVQRALTDKYDYLKDYSLEGLANIGSVDLRNPSSTAVG